MKPLTRPQSTIRKPGGFVRLVSCLALATLGGLLLAGLSTAYAQRTQRGPGPLGGRITTLLAHPDVRETLWGVSVVSLKSGSVLADVNGEKLFMPASTAKLFPAAAALSLLSPSFTYRTGLYLSRSNAGSADAEGTLDTKGLTTGTATDVISSDLLLVGRGDPNLSGRVLPFKRETERDLGVIPVFRKMAEAVAARGIRVIQGNLIADDTWFVHQPHGMGWEADDLPWLSAAPASALAINDNVLFLSIFPGEPGSLARIQELPMEGYYQLDNQAMTVPRTVATPGGGTRRSRRNLGLGREPGSERLQVWGEVPAGAAESSYAVAIEDPARFAAEYLRRQLGGLGVRVEGEVVVKRLMPQDVDDLEGTPYTTGPDPEPAGPAPLAEHLSVPLGESLRTMLKVSQNLHAEMLLRTLGRERRGVGSAQAGLAAINDFLVKNRIASRGVALRDGSGLSRQNMLSPAAMTALLKFMYQSEHGAAWTAMLPEAGVDGTLRNRLRGRYTTGRLWAKTGSLLGVATLAGYVQNQSGDLLAFAIFANHYNEDEGSVLTVIDQIVTALAQSR